jgi:hypothetical protein
LFRVKHYYYNKNKEDVKNFFIFSLFLFFFFSLKYLKFFMFFSVFVDKLGDNSLFLNIQGYLLAVVSFGMKPPRHEFR